MAPSLEQIAYDAALRALDKQEAVVAELRARSGVLLAAASVAVSLFSRLSVLALAAYLVTVGTSLVVLVPRASLRFSISARSAIDRLDPIRGDSAELLRQLVDALHHLWLRNDDLVRWLVRVQRIGFVGLVAQILTMSIATTARLGLT